MIVQGFLIECLVPYFAGFSDDADRWLIFKWSDKPIWENLVGNPGPPLTLLDVVRVARHPAFLPHQVIDAQVFTDRYDCEAKRILLVVFVRSWRFAEKWQVLSLRDLIPR